MEYQMTHTQARAYDGALSRRSVAATGGRLQRHLRWRRWRISAPDEPELLTSAELSECCCPDLCNRDHGND